MEDYKHHIFVSYSHLDEDWVKWTRYTVVRILRSLLRGSLGPHVSIYLDESIETGASWPSHLATNLSQSRLMVALLGRPYFQSQWCRLELALMQDREKSAKLRTPENPLGLIIPLVVDDGNCFPAEVQIMQLQSLHDFANPFIQTDSPKLEALAELLRVQVCPTIETALASVPPFDPAWKQLAHQQFMDMFQIQTQTQKTLPSFTLSES